MCHMANVSCQVSQKRKKIKVVELVGGVCVINRAVCPVCHVLCKTIQPAQGGQQHIYMYNFTVYLNKNGHAITCKYEDKSQPKLCFSTSLSLTEGVCSWQNNLEGNVTSPFLTALGFTVHCKEAKKKCDYLLPRVLLVTHLYGKHLLLTNWNPQWAKKCYNLMHHLLFYLIINQ